MGLPHSTGHRRKREAPPQQPVPGLAELAFGFDLAPALASGADRCLPDPERLADEAQSPHLLLAHRLLDGAGDSLADPEMLASLLALVIPTDRATAAARALLARFGGFGAVLSASPRDLAACTGLPPTVFATLKLVQAAARRLAQARIIDRPFLGNTDALLDYLNTALAHEPVEQVRVLFLNAKNRLLADEAFAQGTIDHAPIYPREIIKRALEFHATALILVHNHPSGDPTPSRTDNEMTAAIREAGALLGIRLHDHLIIGHGRSYSFRREGFCPRA